MKTNLISLLAFCLLNATCNVPDLASTQSNPTETANLLKRARGADDPAGIWLPSKNVTLKAVPKPTRSGRSSNKVTWHDVREQRQWAQRGNLLRSRGNILTDPLKRDTRYRFHCWVLVQQFQITQESKQWLATYPDGMYDQPTVTMGCSGGTWNSGMPWAAYDMTKLGTWQEMSFEFVTPFNTAGGFELHIDTYPSQGDRVRMCSSGVMYIDSPVLQQCRTRIGLTRTRGPLVIDGKLDDWWETNPVVITRDQIVAGPAASNRSMSGVIYTMWDRQHIYLAAKVIDDDFDAARDGIAVWINGREHILTSGNRPERWQVAVSCVPKLGSTTNMYRIVSQFGQEVRGHDGFIMEVAIPICVLQDPVKKGTRFDLALELLDADPDGRVRRLRFPNAAPNTGATATAKAVLANEKGELQSGEYPVYAITDAGNNRGKPRPLAIKNVATHLVQHARIGYPQAVLRRGKTDRVDAIISWTTSARAEGRVEFTRPEDGKKVVTGANGIGDSQGVAMRAILHDLQPNQHYTYRIIAQTASDAPPIYSTSFTLDTRRAPVPNTEDGAIPLVVRETAGAARKKWPVTSGIPFPKGHLGNTNHLRLMAEDGSTVPAQFQPLAQWPDGSVRWALLDFQTDLAPKSVGNFTLQYGNAIEPAPAETTLSVTDKTNRILIDTGPMALTISKADFRLFDEIRIGNHVVAGPGRLCMTDTDGRQYVARRPDILEVEELGPLRTCIHMAGRYVNDKGQPWFDYDLRIHAYAGHPFVRVVHNATCRLKDPGGDQLADRRNPKSVSVGSMTIEFAVANAGNRVRVGTARGGQEITQLLIGNKPLDVRQRYESEALVGNQAFKRLPGWAEVGNVLIAERDFWQLYPNGMRFQSSKDGSCRIGLEVMPSISAADYPSKPGTVEDWVWGYLRGGVYRLRQGESRTHEVFLTFGAEDQTGNTSAILAQLAEPLMAQAEPAWYCDTRAFGDFQPRDARFADYDKAFDQGLKQILARCESEPLFGRRFGMYGMRNFGDHFGSDGMNWDNLEYDFSHCCLTQYLRTGDLRFLRIGRQSHLHNRDVDCITIRKGFEQLCHHTNDHNAKVAGVGHTWCEGAWEYYFLTGDRRSARKALGISNDLGHETAGLCAAGAPGAAGARDYGWSVIGLIAAYRATADPYYLNAAREIEEVAVRTQHPMVGGWIKRLSTGHCFHAPAHTGRVYFMQDIVLNGQVLFHQVTRDADVQQSLLNACQGTLAEIREQQAKGLPGMGYTTCPFLLVPGPWYPRRMKHGFGPPTHYLSMYYACCLPGARNMSKELFDMWPKSGQLWTGSFSSQGKMFAQATRWAPRVMRAIMDLPDVPIDRLISSE